MVARGRSAGPFCFMAPVSGAAIAGIIFGLAARYNPLLTMGIAAGCAVGAAIPSLWR